jgi:hypothetical protein
MAVDNCEGSTRRTPEKSMLQFKGPIMTGFGSARVESEIFPSTILMFVVLVMYVGVARLRFSLYEPCRRIILTVYE